MTPTDIEKLRDEMNSVAGPEVVVGKSRISSLIAALEAAQIEIEAAKKFGGGFFAPEAEDARDWYRDQARALLSKQDSGGRS